MHRDLKPANLLLDASNTLRISDFGLATLRRLPGTDVSVRPDHDEEESTHEGYADLTGVTGSYRFMAPEVYQCFPYGRPVDVYSFSMIAYNVLQGSPPWAEISGDIVVRAACKGERPILPRYYDRRISSLLVDCWRVMPAARPSFAAILDTLGGLEVEGEVEPPFSALGSTSGGCCLLS